MVINSNSSSLVDGKATQLRTFLIYCEWMQFSKGWPFICWLPSSPKVAPCRCQDPAPTASVRMQVVVRYVKGCSRAEYCTLQETHVAGWKMDEHDEHGPFQDSKTYFLLKMWAQVQLWFWKFGKRNSAAPEVEPLGGVGGDGDKECRHRYRPGSWYLLRWIRWQRHCGHLPKRGVTKRNSILGGLHRPRAVAGWQCSGPGEVQCQEYVQKL